MADRKQAWLGELATFIVEANKNTWAADSAEVEPQRPGYQELEWPPVDQRQDWYLRDSYTGYFRAPGTTTIYYKNRTAWVMSYGGHGMLENHYPHVKRTFDFLKDALMSVSPELPFRGPLNYESKGLKYIFQLEQGDLTDCKWNELIKEADEPLFTQTGFAGIVIHRDESKNPVYPWDF